MSSVDNRIVNMQFNNAQFERGIAQSQKSLAAFDNKLNTSFKDSRRSMDDLKALSKGLSFDTITDGVNKIAHSFTLMGRIGLQVMDDIAAKAIRTGKQLVSALTIDPVKSGFREYETQIGAIQTILSNTRSKGTTIDDVNQALDELNKYADMTIYNFTEMTRNIGTFTAAGVDLDTSVSAIKGISNLAAISGSTSTQAATAMYQLSQALASGTIRLMDWNSVVNAGMGGEVFQDALKETARVHGIAIDEMIKKEGSFRETLQNGWLSSEIMLETLQKFTGDLSKEQILAKGYTEEQAEAIMQLGEDANDAATKVKTFSQLIDTLKEALGSGWTNTWEYIIGDFEEARELWTGVSDVLSGIINNSAEARNELLKEWKELGGRDDLIRGLKDAFEALWGIVLAVGDAMDAIFPDVTVDTLLKLSEAVRTFGQNLKSTLAYWKVFKGEYETVETTVTVSEPEVLEGNLRRGLSNDNVKKLQERLAELGYDLGAMGADGIFGPKTEAALKAFQEDYDLLVDGIYGKDTHAKLTEVLGIGSGEETIITRTAQYVTQFGEALQLVQRIAKGAFAALHIGFQGLQFGWEVFKRLADTLSPIGSMFLQIAAAVGDFFVTLDKTISTSHSFDEWLENIDSFLIPVKSKIEDICNAILRFLGIGGEVSEAVSSGLGLESIDFGKSLEAVKAKIAEFFKTVVEFIKGIGEDTVSESTAEVQDAFAGLNIMAVGMSVVAGLLSAGILSAIYQFASVGKNINRVVKGIRDVVDGLAHGKFIEKATIPENLLKIAEAIAILAAAVYVMAQLNLGQLITGLAGVAAVCGILIGTVFALKAVSKGAVGLDKTIGSMLALAAAIGALAFVVFSLGNMSWEQLGRGIAGAVGVMVIAVGSLALLSHFTKSADGLEKTIGLIVTLAGAISAMTGMVTTLGALDIWTLAKGLAGVGILVAILVTIVKTLGGVKANVSSILALIPIVMALAGMVVVFGAMAFLMKAMSLSDIGKTILGFGAIIAAIGSLMLIMSKVKPKVSAILALIPVASAIMLVSLSFMSIALAVRGSTTGDFIKALAGMGAVVLAIYALMKIVSRVKPNISAVLALIPIAVALDAVIFGFMGLLGVMRGATIEELVGALIGLGAIVLAVQLMMSIVSKGRPNVGAVLALVPVALALDLLVLGFAALMQTVKGATVEDIVKTIAALGAMILVVYAFMKQLGKVKPSIGAILALLPVAVALDLLIGGFAALLAVVRNASIEELAKAIGVFLAMVISVNVMLKLMEKVKPSARAILALLPTVVALDLLALGIGALMYSMKGVDPATAAAGIGAFSMVILSMSALMKSLGKGATIKAGISSLISSIGLIGTLAAFAFALDAIKDVGTDKIISFASGLSAIVIAFTTMTSIASKVGLVGMVKGALGLTAAIGIVVVGVTAVVAGLGTLLGAINTLSGGGFVELLEEGAKVLRSMGKMIGSVIGGFVDGIIGDTDVEGYAGDVASFGEALSTFSESTDGITPDSISGAIAASKLISQFVESLPKMGGIVGLWEGDQDFGGFAEDLLLFSSSLSAFGEAVEELADNENLVSDTDSALDVMKSVQEFLDGLGSDNLFEFVKHSNISNMLTLIEEFSESVSVLSVALGGLSNTTISADVESAISAATEVTEALEEMNQLDIDTGGFRIGGWTVIESRTEEILRYIEEFGDAISSITNAFRGLDGDFDIVSAAASAVEAAKKITEFLGGSGEGSIPSLTIPSTTSPIASWFTGGNQIESALQYIKDFGAGMVQVTDAIKNVFTDGEGNPIELDLVGATSKLTEIAQYIVDFLYGTGEEGGIPKLEIPETGASILSWINNDLLGNGPVDQALEDIKKFGASMGSVATAIATALKDEAGNPIDIDIVGVTGDLVESATAITDFLSGAGLNSVPMLTIPDAGSGFMSWIMNGANSTVETLITDIEGFGTSMTQVVGALTAVEGVDDVPTATESLISAAQAVLDFLDEFDDSKYDGIETKTGPFVAFFEGLNKQESFITYLKDFGTNMSEVANAAALIPDPEAFKNQVAAMVDGFNQILDVLLAFGERVDSNDYWSSATLHISSMVSAIEQLGLSMKQLANPVDMDTGATVDYSNLDTLFQPIEDFLGKLIALSDSAGSVGIENIKTLLDNIKTLFVSDTGTEYDTSSWLEGLDAESLATSITDFGNTVTGALMVVRDNLTTYSTDFSNAGKSLISALNTGMTGSSSLAVSGIQTVLDAAHSAADSYRSKFVLVGWDICYGVRDGIRNGTSVVTSMAKSMARQAYNAAKAELDSNSPSKKFMELGEFSSEGFAIGIGNLSRVVEKSASGMGSGALDATKRSIASFASILSDDMEADPVVRPVVDLSDVTKGARQIGTMLSGSRSISVSASADRAGRLAGEMSRSKNERQNGSEEGFMNPISATYGGVNLTGNNFYIRSEQDVRALASEIAVLANSQRRGLGG